jgi:hypothetical protein
MASFRRDYPELHAKYSSFIYLPANKMQMPIIDSDIENMPATGWILEGIIKDHYRASSN